MRWRWRWGADTSMAGFTTSHAQVLYPVERTNYYQRW